ncbi:MAG: hypothetical protein JWQ48_3438 [Conexibacter sp.]|nr:hypothetical protein [Conexibacter sp.]
MPEKCVFCAIVARRVPAAVFWEDAEHLAFLSHRPNTPGFTVVIPKAHLPSYAFELSDDQYVGLLHACRTVGRILDHELSDVGRTGLMLEGFGVDHAHGKLFPMHGTAGPWRPIHSKTDLYFRRYEGYIASNDGPPVALEELLQLAETLKATDAG